jgi:peptidoglycan LD-endopeptidase LytH
MFSAAKYLANSGAAEGEYEKAIFNYNRSEKYVEDVLWFFTKFEESRKEIEASHEKR